VRSVPPLTQPRLPSGALEALPSLRAGGYSYVLFKLGPLQATRRGVALAASASALTFCLLQSAHLCLCTTTPEALAAGLSAALSPLRRCGAAGRAAADEAVLTLLLSVRFCALVFEQGRNLALGLAVRGIDWAALGAMGAADVVASLLGRLLAELFATAAQIADAMRARGYAGPAQAHAALQVSGL
jgi:energy-coupling factor transporter transmembrane protein EcfT